MSHPPTASVAVVTDSSADLSAELVGDLEIAVVPLRVVIGGMQYLEGEEIGAEDVTEAMRTKVAVTTSRPSPQAFLATYARLVDAGFDAVVSVHLSAEVSGTYDSAVLAAAESPAPVEVVDTRTLALGLGFAVRAAARTAAIGGSVVEVAAAARDVAAASRSLFYVDTLEYLRRGGRLSAARALLGSALAVKPILHVAEGRIELLEKVRTSSRARARLADLAVETAGDRPVDLAVQHLAAASRAGELADQLSARIPAAGEVIVREVGAAVGAHVGPGMVAVVIAPRR
ncbi:MAG: DegV family protein [Sporichthyaceae bacterium]|nr:DegV family protein [Sporichthyaceae bacterium]